MTLQSKNLTDPALKIFAQHGAKFVKMSGNKEVLSQCIFCSGKESFSVNIDTKNWKCFKCNNDGGFQRWLQAVSKYCQSAITESQYIRLSRDRGLAIASLKAAHIGYNPWTARYILPVPMMDGPELGDLRIYNIKNHKFISTSGCKVGLYGWDKLKYGGSKIHLTEGEWDGIALTEALAVTNKQDEIVLSVPGAMTFKKEWTSLFQGAVIDVLYDNDEPGKNGHVKVYNSLYGIAQEMNFLHWKPNEKKGKDIRDLYVFLKKKPEAFFKRLRLCMKSEPEEVATSNVQVTGISSTIKFKGPRIPPEQVYATYNKWLLLEGNDLLDIVFGTMIANRLPGDPVWLLLVAQSGGVKSELIMSLDDVVNVVHRDSISANTLISGMAIAGGGDPSLIPRLNGRILTIKDLTVIMEMNENPKKEIISQLRNAFDGKASKELGNNVLRVYVSTFGILAGVTPKIDVYAKGETAIGERFMRWRIPEPRTLEKETDICRRSLHNTTQKVIMRKELAAMGKAALDFEFKDVPELDRSMEDKIISLAEWTAMLRGTIERDRYTKQAIELPMIEMATRLTNGFYKTALGIAMFHNKKETTFDEYKKLKHLAVSTIPAKNKIFIEIMQSKDKGWLLSDLERRIGLPYNTVERIADDLRMLGAVRKVTTHKIKSEFVLTKKSKRLMEETELWQ